MITDDVGACLNTRFRLRRDKIVLARTAIAVLLDVRVEHVFWNDRTPLRLSDRVARGCEFSLLPILGDALEDAGYENQLLLALLRKGDAGAFWVLREEFQKVSCGVDDRTRSHAACARAYHNMGALWGAEPDEIENRSELFWKWFRHLGTHFLYRRMWTVDGAARDPVQVGWVDLVKRKGGDTSYAWSVVPNENGRRSGMLGTLRAAKRAAERAAKNLP